MLVYASRPADGNKKSKNFEKQEIRFLTKRSEYGKIIKLCDERLRREHNEHKKEFEKLEKSS